MGELSYQKRRARRAPYSKMEGGFSVEEKYVVPTLRHGPYARVRWAVEVIRLWNAARMGGVPAKLMKYPAPPKDGKMAGADFFAKGGR